MKKRIFGLLLALVMIVGMIPMTAITAFAADEDVPWVAVGGVKMYAGDTINGDSGSASFDGSTLTLTDYSTSNAYTYDTYVDREFAEYGYITTTNYKACIYSESKSPLTIHLKGINNIAATSSSSGEAVREHNCVRGIYTESCDLIITGTGTLNVDGTRAGTSEDTYDIYVHGTLYLRGGQLNYKEISASGNMKGLEGIRADFITVNGGTLHSQGRVSATYGLLLYDGNVEIASERVGIITSGPVRINGGFLDVWTTDESRYAISCDSFEYSSGVTVQAAVSANGILGSYSASEHTTYRRIRASGAPAEEKRSTLSGNIVGVASNRLVDIELYKSGNLVATKTVPGNGSYSFPDLESGGYTLRATANGYQGYGKNILMSDDVTHTINMTAFTDTYRIGGTIRGVASNAQVTVLLYSSDALVATTTLTGNGNYSFGNLESGSYTIKATANGYVEYSTSVTVDSSDVTHDISMILSEDPGDVDGDGNITSTDARLTLQFYAGKIGEESLNTAVADVDSDGNITSTDARLILQYYAGKITAWP